MQSIERERIIEYLLAVGWSMDEISRFLEYLVTGHAT